jgi:hypothetical protein
MLAIHPGSCLILQTAIDCAGDDTWLQVGHLVNLHALEFELRKDRETPKSSTTAFGDSHGALLGKSYSKVEKYTSGGAPL